MPVEISPGPMLTAARSTEQLANSATAIKQADVMNRDFMIGRSDGFGNVRRTNVPTCDRPLTLIA